MRAPAVKLQSFLPPAASRQRTVCASFSPYAVAAVGVLPRDFPSALYLLGSDRPGALPPKPESAWVATTSEVLECPKKCRDDTPSARNVICEGRGYRRRSNDKRTG